MAYEFLISYAVLYLCAKLVNGAGWKSYWAALLYVLIVTAVPILVIIVASLAVDQSADLGRFGLNYLSLAGQFIVAVITLKLLDHYEDTIAAWLVTFGVGWGILQLV